MKAKMKRTFITLAILACSLVVGMTSAKAAVAPHSTKELEKLATNILVGRSLKVTSKIREFRSSAGELYRDKVFTPTIKVEKVAKGSGIKVGDIVTVEIGRFKLGQRASWAGKVSIFFPRKSNNTVSISEAKRKSSYSRLSKWCDFGEVVIGSRALCQVP